MQYLGQTYLLTEFNSSVASFTKKISSHQNSFIQAISSSNISIGIGNKGLGKTESAIYAALLRLSMGISQKIILTCSSITIPNNFGISEVYKKIITKFIGREKTFKLLNEKVIEVIPIETIATTDLENTIILVEDGQLCTVSEIKTLLKSITYCSRLVLMGDLDDTFLKNNGLKNLVYNFYTKDLNMSIIDLQLILFNE